MKKKYSYLELEKYLFAQYYIIKNNLRLIFLKQK